MSDNEDDDIDDRNCAVGVLLAEARGEGRGRGRGVSAGEGGGQRDERCVCPGRAVDLFVQGFVGQLRLVSVGYQVAVVKLARQ